MRGFRRELTEPRDVQVNQRVIEEHVDDLYYTWRLGPQDFGYLSGVALTAVGNPHTALSFPDGAQTEAFCERHRPTYWIKGNLLVTVYYTGSASSTNNVRIGGRVSPVVAGGSLSATSGTAFTAISTPGPATAGDEGSVTYSDLIPIDASHRHIGMKITRFGADVADTYAGNWYVTQVVVQFYPSGQQL